MTMTDPSGLAPIPLATISKFSGLELFQKIISGDLPAPPVCAVAGLWLVGVEAGRIIWEASPPPNFMNPLGGVHGGWAMTVIDSALACSVHSALPAGRAYTTIEVKTNLTRAPVFGESYRCEGKLITMGRRTGTSEAKLMDEKGRVVAFGTTTCLIFDV